MGISKIAKAIVGAAIVAIVMAGCGNSAPVGYQLAGNDSVAVCTDKTTGQRIADDRCGRNETGMGNFFWYYLLWNSMMPRYGQPVYGGTYTAPRNTRVFRGGVPSAGGKMDVKRPFKPFQTNVPKSQMKKDSWFSKKWGTKSDSGTTKKNGGWGSSGTTKKSGGGWGSSGRSGGSSGGYKGGTSGRR